MPLRGGGSVLVFVRRHRDSKFFQWREKIISFILLHLLFGTSKVLDLLLPNRTLLVKHWRKTNRQNLVEPSSGLHRVLSLLVKEKQSNANASCCEIYLDTKYVYNMHPPSLSLEALWTRLQNALFDTGCSNDWQDVLFGTFIEGTRKQSCGADQKCDGGVSVLLWDPQLNDIVANHIKYSRLFWLTIWTFLNWNKRTAFAKVVTDYTSMDTKATLKSSDAINM